MAARGERGEVNVCTQVIRTIEPRLPNLKIVVSTTTTTGMERLQNVLPSHISKVYYPLDLRGWVSRALGTVSRRPSSCGSRDMAELLWRAMDGKIPLFLVNARLSERSYRGYKRWDFCSAACSERLPGWERRMRPTPSD